MKKVFLFSVVLLVVAIMGLPAAAPAKDPIKIGFFAPMTGFWFWSCKEPANVPLSSGAQGSKIKTSYSVSFP